MRAVDTNVLVRVLVRDDRKQTDLAEEYIARGAWVSHLVLAEAMWVLRSKYALPHHEIATVIELLLDHTQFALQEPDVVEAALDHYRAKPSIGFSDCLVLEIARKVGHLPLGTFDRMLNRLDGATRP